MPQCPCYVGTNQSQRTGLYCYDSLGQTVPQGGCCGNSMGSYGNPLHPLCNGKTCNNLNYGNASHGCWDSNPAWGSVVPGGTPDDDPIEFMPDYDLEIDRTDLKTDIDREKNIDKEKYLSRKIKEIKKSKLRKIIRESIKEMMGEKQPLNEIQNCNPGTEGTSCSSSNHIWCQFADGASHSIYSGGCFCVTPAQCNQFGSNEVCDNVVNPNSPACNPGRGKEVKPSTDKLKSRDRRSNDPMSRDNDKMMREIEDLELEPSSDPLARPDKACYKCFGFVRSNGRGVASCKKQQFDLNGKCPDGWKSHSKCMKKCRKKWDTGKIGPSSPTSQTKSF